MDTTIFSSNKNNDKISPGDFLSARFLFFPSKNAFRKLETQKFEEKEIMGFKNCITLFLL